MPNEYKIINTHRFSRFLDGGKITVRRGSPVPVSFEKLKQLRDQLIKEGDKLEVRNAKGQLVDLKSGRGIIFDDGRAYGEPSEQQPEQQQPEQQPVQAQQEELKEPLPVVPEAPVPDINPRPNFPLDSAANDKTFEHGVGEHIPVMQGGKGIGEEVPVPSTGLPGMGEEKPVAAAGDPVAARKSERKSKKDRGEAVE